MVLLTYVLQEVSIQEEGRGFLRLFDLLMAVSCLISAADLKAKYKNRTFSLKCRPFFKCYHIK